MEYRFDTQGSCGNDARACSTFSLIHAYGLNLAADPRQRPLLENLRAFMALGHLDLIIPRVVVDEFKANRDRVAQEGVKGISSQVQQVKDAVKALEGNQRRTSTRPLQVSSALSSCQGSRGGPDTPA